MTHEHDIHLALSVQLRTLLVMLNSRLSSLQLSSAAVLVPAPASSEATAPGRPQLICSSSSGML